MSSQEQERRQRCVLKLPAVMQRTRLSRSTIYEAIADGTFPAPIRLGPRAVAWVEDEVGDWLEARIAQRDRGETKPANDPATNRPRSPSRERL